MYYDVIGFWMLENGIVFGLCCSSHNMIGWESSLVLRVVGIESAVQLDAASLWRPGAVTMDSEFR